jgi:hypothetical protein
MASPGDRRDAGRHGRVVVVLVETVLTELVAEQVIVAADVEGL